MKTMRLSLSSRLHAGFGDMRAQGPALPLPPQEDCLGCRVVGTGSMLGVSGYLLYERHCLLRTARTNRALLATGSLVAASLGVYRWIVGTPLDPFEEEQD